MFSRLKNALKYLFTGSLDDAAAPIDNAPTAPDDKALILKDTHVAADGRKTSIEVRGDGIALGHEDGQLELIPFTADEVSLNEIDADIRYQIARKISLLVPDLTERKKEQLLRHVFHVLFFMARDQMPRVRQMIAEELSESYNVPPELIRKLAWDEHLEVSAPILEYSPLLGDDDLLEIISNSDIPGVIEAVSRRREVSTDVTDAIVRNVTLSKVTKDDARVINNLLANKRARFKEETLEIIVGEAADYEMWHESLVDRPELTTRTINKIARFVSQSLIMEMEDRGMITKELSNNLSQAIASRLHNIHIDREKEADRTAIDLFTQGDLDSQYVMMALDSGEREFVVSAMSLLADMPKSVARKIIDSEDPKAVTALSWKSGLTMRDAIQIQLKLAKIHYSKLLYARNGKHYPLSKDEMTRILRSFSRDAA